MVLKGRHTPQKRAPDGFKGTVNPTTHKPKTFTRNSKNLKTLIPSHHPIAIPQ